MTRLFGVFTLLWVQILTTVGARAPEVEPVPIGGVATELRFKDLGAMAHMHYRGKDFVMRVTENDATRTLLAVPGYLFDWQMGYQWPVQRVFASAGARFSAVGHFDDSRFNLLNPDANATVSYGEQSNDEMMYGFLFYLLREEDLNLEL